MNDTTVFPPDTARRGMARWYSFENARRFIGNYVRGVRRGHPDHREALAAADTPAEPGWEPYVDLAPGGDEKGESWVDYMSDVGDGYDAVHTVAYVSEAPMLTGLQGADRDLPRAHALLLGGDTAYPIADGATLRERLLRPHHDARTQWRQGVRPWLAIPGNHDWYDDLRGFREVFIDSRLDGERGGAAEHFHTPQRRSYFAARLAHNWWVLAADFERTGDLDPDQVVYFERALRYAGAYPQPRVILITHDPLPSAAGPAGSSALPPKLRGLLEWLTLQRAEVKLWLSGDLHFYRHDGPHGDAPDRIICGGGGAFLHPTHAEDPPAEGAPQPRFFPEPAESRKCARRGLWFAWHNPTTNVLLAALYAGAFLLSEALKGGPAGWPSLAFAAILFLCAEGFAATQGLLFGATMGLLHGASQAALYLCGAQWMHAQPHGWLGMVALGGLAAPTLFGWYLWAALRFFRKHRNGAFSALRIAQFKSFLRLHVDDTGALRVYPIGIRDVRGDYAAHRNPGAYPPREQRLHPDDADGPTFELIGEAPIHIGR